MFAQRIHAVHAVTEAVRRTFRTGQCLLTAVLLVAGSTGAHADTSVEGFGTTTRGGEDQPVYHVTHLGNDGPGSLRDAVSTGHRKVVFDVAGEIVLSDPHPGPRTPDPNIYVRGAFITIDGFTAPPPGITLVGGGLTLRGDLGAHDVIVRGLRIRTVPFDGVQVALGAYNVVLSNLSVWDSGDGLIDITENSHDVTVAWSILAGAIKATLVKYDVSGVTLLGNLWVNARNRNPQVSVDDAGTPATETTVDMRNNVVYDWAGGAGTIIHHGARANVVANFYSSPSSTAAAKKRAITVCQGATCFDGDPRNIARAFVAGNLSGDLFPIDINDAGTETAPFPAPPLAVVDACTAAKRVLASAGVRPLDDIDRAFLDPITFPVCRRTTTTLSATANSSLYDEPVTFTATVRVQPPATGPARGSVTFVNGSSEVATVPLVDGTAAITVATLGLGTTTVWARYSGDVDFDPSQASLSHTVSGSSTITGLTAAPNLSFVGLPVTLSATVTTTPASAAMPTGTVRFLDGSNLLAPPLPVENGRATLVTSALPPGIRSVTAKYSGDAGLAPSTSRAVSLRIDGGSVTTLMASHSKIEIGQPVTFTATVSPVTGVSLPTGLVAFRDGAATVERPLVDGKSVWATSALSVGAHAVVASYAGSPDYQPSASRSVTANVVKGKTKTEISATPMGQFVTLTVRVTRAAPVPGIPDGTVQFKNGGTILATVSLSSEGTAQFNTMTLGAGIYTIIGAYSGSPSFAASNSPKVKVTVKP